MFLDLKSEIINTSEKINMVFPKNCDCVFFGKINQEKFVF